MSKKKNNRPKPRIKFPVLYDEWIYRENIILKFIFFKTYKRKLMEHRKGYYNYETDKFEVPEKDFKRISKNPKLAFDLEILTEVGYKVI